jgi:N-acetylmuramoyl-L-alanine amidase
MLKVLVQKGHVYPREPGFEEGTGTNREQELVSLIADELVLLLERDGRFAPVVVPGDIPDGIKVDAAVFLHGDGSVNPSASGYCFGYPEYGVNKELADLIAVEFDKIPGHPPHRRDNYTGSLRGYYGYSRVNTPGPEVLVEHGFLTNPGERLWLFANVKQLARAEYRALCAYFGFVPRDDAANRRRLSALRNWILKEKRSGKTWVWIKRTPNWREFIRRGGK